MKKSRFLPFVLIIGITMLFSLNLYSQDWPGWRGPNRDAKVVGFKAPASWPAQLTKVWQTSVGLSDASVSYVAGKLFLNVKQETNEVALCLDAATGNKIWSTVLNPAPVITGGPASHPGPRSTPEIAGGKVFLLGAGGIFTCLDAATGKIIWQNTSYSEVPQFFTSFSPLVVGDKVVVNLGGHNNGVVLAFDAANGNKIWQLEGQPSTYASPVLMKIGKENIIVLQSETDLLGISVDGKQLWKVPTPGQQRFYNAATPVINGADVIIAGQGLGTRSIKIQKSGDAYNTTENWVNSALGVSFNTPVLKDGFLYGQESGQGKLYCLNASTGATCWTDSLKHDRFSSLLDLGKVLLSLPASAGELLFFEPNPKSLVELAKYKVAETPTYSHPLVIGNKIIIKEKELLTCWSVQ